jgi:hypothetical protein
MNGTKALSNEEIMMPSLLEFFKKGYNFNVLEEWLESNKSRSNKQSLRILDWFNTNYSKQYNVEYRLKKGNTTTKVYAWDKYNSTLSSGYGKGLFDPFGRGKKAGKTIYLEHDGKIISTTLAQLNYFRWAIKNGIIDYVKLHLDEIYNDMHDRTVMRRNNKKGTKSKISKSTGNMLHKQNVEVVISFNPEVPLD